MTRWRRPATALAVVALVGLLPGCSGGRERLVDGEGPLSSQMLNGLSSIFKPKAKAWWSVFGSIDLCSVDGKPARITDIRYKTAVEPRSIESIIRYVPAPPHPKGPASWGLVITRRGSADRVPGSLPGSIAGSYTPFQAPLVIDEPCGGDPLGPFTEVVTVMTVGPAGGWIEWVDIDYESDGKLYTLQTGWQYVACGKRIVGTDVCDR